MRSYFKSLNVSIYAEKDKWETTQIGRLIDSYVADDFPDLNHAEIAIFNVLEYEGSKNNFSTEECSIRASFYQLHQQNFPRIVDLGVLQLMSTRKESFNIIKDVCKTLINNGIVPVVIGGGNDISYAIYEAYASLERYITLTSVDRNFDIGLQDDNLASYSYLGKIISRKPSYLFHYVNLGYQTYFVSSIATDMLRAMNFDFFRIGELKSSFQEVEPVMRNTDFLSFDISSIKSTYAPANVYSSPNGLNSEEACKVMHYAGLSDKLSAVGLFEYNQSLDLTGHTSQLLSQMIWYFIEGYKMRKKELNPNLKECIKYTVSFEDGKNLIEFYKSQNSGRWWMGVPFKKEGENKIQNYFVACSYKDYEIANKGEVPDRWLKTYNKFI